MPTLPKDPGILKTRRGLELRLQHLNGSSPFLGLAWALTIVVCEPHRHEFGMSRALDVRLRVSREKAEL